MVRGYAFQTKKYSPYTEKNSAKYTQKAANITENVCPYNWKAERSIAFNEILVKSLSINMEITRNHTHKSESYPDHIVRNEVYPKMIQSHNPALWST